MKPHLAKFTIRLTICAVALLLSNRWCFAVDCPNDGHVTPADEETLASQYQPYGSILHRFRFVPPAPYAPPYPTVIMLPPDVFKLEYGDYGNTSEKWASYDLQQAGFLVFQVNHRLAPPGALEGQAPRSVNDNGGFPDQTDDLKRQIMAALADSQCNGNIYLVGGSAGGTLVLWVMLDSSATFPNCGWNETARAHIKAVVSFSGPTDFCDWSNPGNIPPTALTQFENDLDNYVNLLPQTDCAHDPNGNLEHASPEWLVTNGATSNPPPIRLYSTTGDPVPNSQATDMYNALRSQFPSLDVVKYKMSYQYGDPHDHAYRYWHAQNDDPTSDGQCVSQEVITFLQSH